ncbi:MAG: hypothetical protein ACYDA1_00090 [Vulcanimicrobiaceae bacterium]
MKPPSYASDYQRQEFAKWLEAERVRTHTSKTRLAEALGRQGTSQVGDFLSGKTLPLPSTLRRLCDVMKIEWFTAFASAGYYRSILLLLDDLVTLSKKWCVEDDVLPSPISNEFTFSGVVKIGGSHAYQAIVDGSRAKRYMAGTYTDNPGIAVTAGCVVPKPLGAAIFVGVAGFPRRGDVYKDGASRYPAELLSAADNIIKLAQSPNDGRRPAGLLAEVDGALSRPSLPFEQRRMIAAEYMTAWCDANCQRFTYYARLAIYDQWGEAGSSTSTATPYVIMPQIRQAERPPVSSFQM